LFWDPNIYGRYLALALLLGVSCLVWIGDRRRSLLFSLALAFLWAGLLFAWSQSSFISLVVGLLVLVALRYDLRWAVVAAPLAVLAILAAVFLGADRDDSRGAAAAVTSGRTSLVSGGLALAVDRPFAGWGSGSFSRAFAEREGLDPDQTSVSHNEAITIAAEQGVLGLTAYALVLLTALWTLFGGLRSVAPGLGGAPPSGGARLLTLQVRMGLAAGFCLLFAHTMGYAGFLTDPLTWALLALAAAFGGRSLDRG
ncbi:MAG: O-antigen ligase family protein, partial [bacterium]